MDLAIQSPGLYLIPKTYRRGTNCRRGVHFAVNCCRRDSSDEHRQLKRRDVLITPFLAAGAYALRSAVAKAAAEGEVRNPKPQTEKLPDEAIVEAEAVDDMISSRIYDATVIGEPMALGKENRKKVWEKMMDARVVYLGEAEQVPVQDDRELELEIVKNLRRRCGEAQRLLSLALEAFPCNLQEQLDQYMDNRIDGEILKSFVTHWSKQRWQEYEPLLTYCRDNGVRLIACGVPLEILRTVQSLGVRGLSKSDREKYAPPFGSGFISALPSISRRSSMAVNFPNQSTPYGPRSYLSIQARAVEDYTMSEIILQSMTEVGSAGMLVVVTGAGHVAYGPRGTGIPARIARKMQKKNQLVILLDPERQSIRREGEVPVADFLWYSAARPCSRNCFDRAEISRVMNAAGRRRNALPQDLQKGLDLGVVSPEVLQNFFDLEQYPILSELTNRFQGFRERLLADPKFLYRLAMEETITITATLLAQYERRKENFFKELDYVITDTARCTVTDFFTVWLPAPTLSFLTSGDSGIHASGGVEGLKDLLGSLPDNAFQKNFAGRYWSLDQRIATVFVSSFKLAAIGFVSTLAAVSGSNGLYEVRKFLNPTYADEQVIKRPPMIKSALVYSFFLAASSNLRYQMIAGILEHRILEPFADQTLLINLISFVARTINVYWGAQQWVDLAKYTKIQALKSEEDQSQALDASNSAPLECNLIEDSQIDETSTQ